MVRKAVVASSLAQSRDGGRQRGPPRIATLLPLRVRLPCQKTCLGTDGRLGIVILNYRLVARRVEPLWVRRAHLADGGDDVVLRTEPRSSANSPRPISVRLMATAYCRAKKEMVCWGTPNLD